MDFSYFTSGRGAVVLSVTVPLADHDTGACPPACLLAFPCPSLCSFPFNIFSKALQQLLNITLWDDKHGPSSLLQRVSILQPFEATAACAWNRGPDRLCMNGCRAATCPASQLPKRRKAQAEIPWCVCILGLCSKRV